MATPSVRTSPSRPAPFAAAKRRPVLLRCAVRRPYWSAGRRSASNAPPRRTSPRSPCAPEATTTTTTSKTGGCARRPSTSPSAGGPAADSMRPTCGPPTSARCRRRRRRRRRRPRRRRTRRCRRRLHPRPRAASGSPTSTLSALTATYLRGPLPESYGRKIYGRLPSTRPQNSLRAATLTSLHPVTSPV